MHVASLALPRRQVLTIFSDLRCLDPACCTLERELSGNARVAVLSDIAHQIFIDTAIFAVSGSKYPASALNVSDNRHGLRAVDKDFEARDISPLADDIYIPDEIGVAGFIARQDRIPIFIRRRSRKTECLKAGGSEPLRLILAKFDGRTEANPSLSGFVLSLETDERITIPAPSLKSFDYLRWIVIIAAWFRQNETIRRAEYITIDQISAIYQPGDGWPFYHHLKDIRETRSIGALWSPRKTNDDRIGISCEDV